MRVFSRVSRCLKAANSELICPRVRVGEQRISLLLQRCYLPTRVSLHRLVLDQSQEQATPEGTKPFQLPHGAFQLEEVVEDAVGFFFEGGGSRCCKACT